MIAKLKIQCGTQFTSKMEGMLADLAVGNQHRAEFQQHRKRTDTKLLDFNVQVLTTGFWPTYKSPRVALTSAMQESMAVFWDWHDNRHQKRKLTWIMSQGNATVHAIFGAKPKQPKGSSYDFQVSTLQ